MIHGFDFHLFLSTFALIFVAEWPDKTAFAVLIMATQRHPFAVFVGVALAFLIQTVIAVAFGSVLALLPQHAVRLGAGALFLVFALAMWLQKEIAKEEEEFVENERASFWKAVGSSFLVIFLAEWGDLTQLATAALEARYSKPATIFPAAVLALWSTTALAVLIGHRAKNWINPRLLQRIAAIAFAIVGILILLKASA